MIINAKCQLASHILITEAVRFVGSRRGPSIGCGCPVLGRKSAPHDEFRDVLSHLVVPNGAAEAAVVETRLTITDGSTCDADVDYFDPSSVGARELDWMGSMRS